MKLRSSLLAPGLLMLFSLLGKLPLVEAPEQKIQRFIKETYGTSLDVTDEQVNQLSWLLAPSENASEMEITYTFDGRTLTIHREVPRALSRLYNLQLLHSGTEKDYRTFVAPQLKGEPLFLSYSSFQALSRQIKDLDEETYETLKTATIINAAAHSGKARERADVILETLPATDEQFLYQSARHTSAIYPLARSLMARFPGAAEVFKIIFLPDTDLRHMMYGAGSQNMFQEFRQQACGGDPDACVKNQKLLFAYGITYLSGFRGDSSPVGSLYLNQNNVDALSDLALAIKAHSNTPDSPKEFSTYVGERAKRLNLQSDETSDSEKIQALAMLAVQTRVYSPELGKDLTKYFDELAPSDQERWTQYTSKQLSPQQDAEPTPAYLPLFMVHSVTAGSLEQTVSRTIPLVLDVMDQAKRLREQERMKPETRLSFKTLASMSSVEQMLSAESRPELEVNPDTGMISFKSVEKPDSEEQETSESQDKAPQSYRTTHYLAFRVRHLLPSL